MKKRGLAFIVFMTVIMSMTACVNDRDTEEIQTENTESIKMEEENTILKTEDSTVVKLTEEETRVEQETEGYSEEMSSEISTIEIPDEDYCYAILLQDMMKKPNQYWTYIENVPENNRFAVVDINSDGIKELLVEYDSCAADREEYFKYIDIYQYNDVMCTIMNQATEFYTDGTIIDTYISEYRRSGTWVYNNFEEVSHVDIWDIKNLNCDIDENGEYYNMYDSMAADEVDKDIDGDGIVYNWYDFVDDNPTEQQSISEDEYKERLDQIRKGKERVDFTWNYITSENIDKLINIQAQNKKVFQDTESDAEPKWVSAYKDFLRDKWNLKDLLMEQSEAGLRGYIQGFYLHDINLDGIPELIVSKIYASTCIYTYADNGVELRSLIQYNSCSDEMIGYDVRDNKTYIYFSDAGTDVCRGTGISEVLLPTEQFTEDNRSWGFGKNVLYSAYYGDIESDDGNYLYIEWKDAIRDDSSKISKDEFMSIVQNFSPLVYIKITDENLDKYICTDYDSLQPKKNLDDYKEEVENEYNNFMNMKHATEENLPTIYEFDRTKVYVDIDNLEIY